MIQITKAVRFCASHRYWREDWSAEENARRFGKCTNIHGHNYRLEITIQGEPAPDTGMIIDLKEVKIILQQMIIDPLDHQYLNEAVPYFKEHIPTTENLVIYIRDILQKAFLPATVKRIRLWEDIDLSVEWEEISDADFD